MNFRLLPVFFALFYSTFSFNQEIEVITQEKIQGVITILSYSPDGSLIASGSARENSVKVWDVSSGKIIGKLEGHDAATTAIGFNADGTILYTSAKDDRTMVWDIVNWQLIDSINIGAPVSGFVNSLTEPNVFYACTQGGKVLKWSTLDFQHPVELYKEDFPIMRIDVSKSRVVSGNSSGRVTLYNLESGSIERSEKIHATGVKGLRFFNDGTGLITTGGGGLVHIWNVEDLHESKHFTASATPIVAFDANVSKQRFVTASQTKELKVWDFDGNLVFEFKGRTDENESSEVVNALTISPDGSTFASTGFRRTQSQKSKENDNVIRVWDMNRGTLLKTLGGTVNPIYTFDFHPVRNELVTLGDDRILTFWDFNVAEKYGTFQLIEPKREIPPRRKSLPNVTNDPIGKIKRIKSGAIVGDIRDGIKTTTTDVGTSVVKRAFSELEIIKFSSQGNYLITKLPNDEIRLYTLKDRKPEYQRPLWSYQLNVNQMLTSPDEKYLVVLGSGDSAVSVIDMQTFEFVDKLHTPAPTGRLSYVYEANSLAFSPDGKYLAVCFNTSKTFVFEVGSWKLVFENILPDNLGYSKGCFVNFSKDGQYMVVNSMFGVKKYLTAGFGVSASEKLQIEGYSAPMDKPSDYAITLKDDHIWFENLLSGETVKSLRAEPKQVTHISMSPGGMAGITFKSGQFMIIDPSTGKDELLLVADGDNYIMKTNENFYRVSKEGCDLVTFRIGNRAYPFEQFDAVFNRPDLVLKKMNCTDTVLMNLYEKAYQKRIKKLGLQPTSKVTLTDIPSMKITNEAAVPAVTDKSTVAVSLEMSDSRSLASYNVWVNNVPVFGKKGKPVAGKTKLTVTEQVNLVYGLNKVQVACRNTSGYESLIETFYVEKTGEIPSRDLYLITIGTSVYKDSRYNLNYAVKDAQDLVTLLSSNSSGIYHEVKTKSLLNEQVTSSNVEALKTFLASSKPDDVVMVFVAGHGVLDNNFDYYFGTHDMDFGNPSGKGLAYERLEGILDGIRANRKILIMDTCHSGEIDKEDVFFTESTGEEEEDQGDISFRAVGAAVEENATNATPTRLASELFNDLRKGTGSTVISSAGGAEFAMESDQWRNGLFTYCLLNGLQSRTADLNGDGSIMLLELQEYLVTKVSALSSGKQIPNTRIQNLELDFRFW